MNLLYKDLSITKQAVHQGVNRALKHYEEASYLVNIIVQVRHDHPTMSCEGMYYRINPRTMGRDKFVQFCMDHGFRSAAPVNRRRTTDSSGVIRFDNLTLDFPVTGINQVWSSDITYFPVRNEFFYITFIIDNYSRRILGWNVSKRLTTESTTLPALKKAVNVRRKNLPKGIIFHSDGGGQYYDKNFVHYTQKTLHMKNSMCDYPWKNGIAERLNGVIKNCYLTHWSIKTYEDLVKMVDRAVDLYNREKPHKSLKFKSPIAFEETLL